MSAYSPASLPALDDVRAEISRRGIVTVDPAIQRARAGLLAFTEHTYSGYAANWHHDALCRSLDRFVSREIRRLMVFMPPQHGKSELVSRRLPAYVLGRNPDARIIACSYGADLSARMNRDVQRIIDSDEYAQVFGQTRLYGSNVRTTAQGTWLRNSDIFEVVDHRGVYRSSGVGGGITGMGFDYGIIDDPVKNAEEAHSETYRDGVWDWYTSTFYTRQSGNACILITLTRWHEDDLAGRLLKLAAEDPTADQWTVICFPAVADGRFADDPRRHGEPLWPDRYGLDFLTKTKAGLGSYQWSALYQQQPAPAEGALFQRSWFEIVDAVPAHAARVRAWDKGGTEGAGDPTAGVRMAKADGLYYVEDVEHGQWSAGERNKVMRQTAALDGVDVRIELEQEPGSGGKESAEISIRQLAGYVVYAHPASGDKVTRAMPFAAQAEAGNVKLLRGPWNKGYLDEMQSFPHGTHDDRVDASATAFNTLALMCGPLTIWGGDMGAPQTEDEKRVAEQAAIEDSAKLVQDEIARNGVYWPGG